MEVCLNPYQYYLLSLEQSAIAPHNGGTSLQGGHRIFNHYPVAA